MKILPTAMPIAEMNEFISMLADRLAAGARAADEDGAVVVLQRMAARRQRHVAADHGRGVMGRGDQRQIDRKGDDEDAERQDGVGDDVAERAVLDHQYCTLRST